MSKTVKRNRFESEHPQEDPGWKKKAEKQRREKRRHKHDAGNNAFGVDDGGSESMYLNKG